MAQVIDPFENNQNIHPIYEGMGKFENPPYEPYNIEDILDNRFVDPNHVK
jgi:hypothetical protein